MTDLYQTQRAMRTLRRTAIQRGVVAILDVGTSKIAWLVLRFDGYESQADSDGVGPMAGQSTFRVIGAATTRSRGVRFGEIAVMNETEPPASSSSPTSVTLDGLEQKAPRIAAALRHQPEFMRPADRDPPRETSPWPSRRPRIAAREEPRPHTPSRGPRDARRARRCGASDGSGTLGSWCWIVCSSATGSTSSSGVRVALSSRATASCSPT